MNDIKITKLTYSSDIIGSHSINKITINFNYTFETSYNTKNESKTSRSFTIHQQPTGNCQLSTICTFANISIFSNEDLINIFKFAHNRSYVKLLLFDVNKEYVQKIEKLFSKKYICFKNEYISTNKSEMCLFGINLRSFVADNTPKEEVKVISDVQEHTIQEDELLNAVESAFQNSEPIREYPLTEKETFKITKVKPKKDGCVINTNISPQQREQIRNISNRHKF